MKNKEFFALILTFFLFALLPVTSSFATTTGGSCGENLTWTLENGTLTLSGTGAMADYSTRSDVPWYFCRSQISTVVIQTGVTSISDFGFYGCTGLTGVTIGSSVTQIGSSAFYGCTGLRDISIGSQVAIIGDHAFASCTGLTQIALPDSVTTIGSSAFYKCTSLITANLGTGVREIGVGAFSQCTNLTDLTMECPVTIIGAEAFYGCAGLTAIAIPDSVTGIGERAFRECTGLTSATMGNSVVSIGKSTFSGCTRLEELTIGTGLTRIDDYAFQNCTGLVSLTLPDSVTDIGDSAFWGCTALTRVQIGNGITAIGDSAFYGCTALTDLTIGNQVTIIGNLAFCKCTSLKTVAIPQGVTTVGGEAFLKCAGLEAITIPASVTGIGRGAFADCSALTDVYYTGDENGWNAISVGGENDPLTGATLHCNYSPPSITDQPTTRRVTDGTTARFTVTASGEGISCQWQYRTSSSGTWKNSGASTANKATVKVTGKTSRNGYQYRCVITDCAGNVVTSQPADLYVLGITTQPGDAHVTESAIARFTVTATGDGLTYQWQYRTSSSGTWKNSGASTASKPTVKVTGKTSRNGYQYRCVITDCAGNVVTSQPADLYVLGITAQPGDVRVSEGEMAAFTVSATGDGLTYQWQYRTSSSGTWKNSGASTANEATVKVTGKASRNGYQYRCVITDSAGNVVCSQPATLQIS